jgi:hypothetical protein
LKRYWIILSLLFGLTIPVEAGIEYRARTWQEGQQKNKQAEMTVWARIDGDNARIAFEESGNPWMTSGSYLLTTDAGETLFLVKPEDKTYGEFDLDAIMQMLGALSESGVVDFQIENPQVETLERGPGKTVADLATEHARYRTTYDMQIKVLGFKNRQNVQTVQDVWYTTAVRDAAMGVWLRKEPPRTGTDLDRLIDLEIDKIEGFPLETLTTTINTGKKGKQTTITTHMLVSELDRGASFPAGTFVIPADFTPVELMPTDAMLAGGDQSPADGEEPEKKGGMLGRFKKFGKKKDG